MAAICLAIAADGPTNRVTEDGYIKSFRLDHVRDGAWP
jgi:hypothetical protein